MKIVGPREYRHKISRAYAYSTIVDIHNRDILSHHPLSRLLPPPHLPIELNRHTVAKEDRERRGLFGGNET